MNEKRGDALCEATLKGLQAIEASPPYYRLLLVVAPPGAGKSRALGEVAKQRGANVVNLSLHLAERLLELSARQRPMAVDRALQSIVENAATNDLVLLDNIELLFDATLGVDPLRCLQHVARLHTLVASWPSSIQDGELVYAEPGHPEHRSYPAHEILIAR